MIGYPRKNSTFYLEERKIAITPHLSGLQGHAWWIFFIKTVSHIGFKIVLFRLHLDGAGI